MSSLWFPSSLEELPASFLEFCKQQEIDPRIYLAASDIPRFIRVKITEDESKVIEELKQQLQGQITSIERVEWLPAKYRFYKIFPQHVSISKCDAYITGKVFGMDISSAVAVVALNPKPNDKILDMCCAPGAKLGFIADSIQLAAAESKILPHFHLTGVDINLARLTIARTLLTKYQVPNTRLILADGTLFNIDPANGNVPLHCTNSRELKRRIKKLKQKQEAGEEVNIKSEFGNDAGLLLYQGVGVFRDEHIAQQKQHKKRPATSPEQCDSTSVEQSAKRQRLDEVGLSLPTSTSSTATPGSSAGRELFDRVIVDAECSTDGSVKHLLKALSKDKDHFTEKSLSKEKLNAIVELQKKLILNGFNQLKVGGTLVYSTCSLTTGQNEGVVRWLLETVGTESAELVEPFDDWEDSELKNKVTAITAPTKMEHTLRFDPISGKTSGLFVCKIRKNR